MKLYIDFRERSVINLVKDLCEDLEFTQLPLGDYLLSTDDNAVIIERKNVRDFLSSVRSNRLWDQLLRLMKAEEVLGYTIKRRILVIHGVFQGYIDEIGYSQKEALVFWSQIMGALMEILYAYNTPIILVEDDLALTSFFKTLIRREIKGLNDKLPTARWYKKRARVDLPVKDRKTYILSSFPMIGDLLAKKLLEHFETITDIANASLSELQKVPKIGKKKAEIIYRLFHSKSGL